MALTEQDVRQIIRDEIRKAFGFNQSQDIEFLPTAKAYKKLCYPSANQLREAVKNETLRLGIEVQDRRSKNSVYSNYYFNIPACINRLNTSPEKRGA